MEKREFTYQRYFLRVLIAAGVGCIISIWIDPILEKIFERFLSSLIYIVIMIILFSVYFKYTHSCKLFVRKGEYWVENGIVVIKKDKKVYTLNNIKAIMGMKLSFCGFAKTGLLRIYSRHKNIRLTSLSNDIMEDFSDSELFPLFETILENNPQLKKDDELDFYYEIEK